MRIIFTNHLRDRLRDRGITADQVIQVIHQRHTTYPGNGGNETCILGLIPPGRTLKVVIIEKPSGVIIVKTTAWRDEE